MANNENLDFSYTNLDYTAKDFGSIYPQMLDLAKQLTNKWDPSQSNESDPGVVLIKEGAFVADHNNYNIDKNILENFLPSATQDKSVRNITEMNGYTPRYYVSATGDITFTWNKKEDDENTDFFSIPAFTLVVTDANETVSYTQIEPLTINGSGVQSACEFIEGTLQQLVVNDSNIITLENIDDNNRLYLPESMVAQNGVYIKNTNSSDYNDYWVRNNYILTQPLGLHIYKIDYDSDKDLPYIEFPSDIANIIGDGLEISYIATSGIGGNVSANKLTKIISPSTFNAIDEEDITRSVDGFVKISNSYAITNGKNPETIDEMYQSFKRIVGTFDTLVTCKDYENEIYMMEDENNNPLVSNVYVTDRRTDFNKAAQVITYDIENNSTRFKSISTDKCSLHFVTAVDSLDDMTSTIPGDMYYFTGNETVNAGLYINMSTITGRTQYENHNDINLNDFAILTAAMTPYDLVIYAFKVLALTDINNQKTIAADYNLSFGPVTNTRLTEIENYIENVKCISHTYKYPNSSDYLVFKNYAPIKVEIETYKKIEYKQTYDSIITNVYTALARNFNPRNIEFGIKLDEDKVKRIIINSDDRIKNADIYILDYLPYAAKNSYTEGKQDEEPITDTSEILLDLISKNVLAGRICMFEFDKRFTFDYGQINGSIYADQDEVKTELYIPLSTDNTLKQATPDQTILEGSTRYNSNGQNYQYEYINYSREGGIPHLTQVALPKYDEETNKSVFILYEIRDGEVANTYTYKSEGTAQEGKTEIFISNNLDGTEPLPQTSATGKQDLPAGDIIVFKKKGVINYEYNTPNIDYTLNENEAFQIIYPNFYSEKTYSLYVNYRYECDNDISKVIKANDDYTLGSGERLIFVYNDQGVVTTEILTTGDVVKSSFDIRVTDTVAGVSRKEYRALNGSTNTAAFKTITSGQSIEKRILMRTIIDNVGPWCYWIVNGENGANTLFKAEETVKVLKSNEYFIYTNASVNEIMVLGAGTRLERTINPEIEGSGNSWTIQGSSISIDSIEKTGISLDIPWQKNIDFARQPFYITEMNVITLGESDNITIYGWDPNLMPNAGTVEHPVRAFCYNNDDVSLCDGIISYTTNSTTVTLPRHQNFYYVKARFDLNISPTVEQKLITKKSENDDIISSQRIHLKDNGEVIISSDESQKYVQASETIATIGNLISLLPDLEGHYPDFYVYEKDGLTYARSLKLTAITTEEKKYTFFAENPTNKTYIVPIHIIGDELKVDVWFTGKDSNGSDYPAVNIKDYNVTEGSSRMTLDGNNSYYLVPVADEQYPFTKNSTLTLNIIWSDKATSQNQVIMIDNITVIDGVNKELESLSTAIEGNNALERINTRIMNIIQNSDQPSTKPYYPYQLDNSIAMNKFARNYDEEHRTESIAWGDTLWDTNNIVNKMTLAQIDLNKMINSKLVRIKNDNIDSSLLGKV